ncbi:hypothetical protein METBISCDRAFT_23468 [Metschnikowia bicuspidata]|uniref:RING-14 protein n=1 Tax=Metschnikowia bicuspidata TaxID=27322 RepID=A0A4P9ZDQ8_9ASCO|nr:hypothetical protein METBISCDRAFT_23468 [Metschnikowia bicuspidata]
MKFAKVLEETLRTGDLPPKWVEAAIQYKLLKKCISKFVRELALLGLSLADLKLLLQDDEQDLSVEIHHEDAPENPIVTHYALKKSKNNVIPYLKIVLNDEDPDKYSKDYIHELADQIRQKLLSVVHFDNDERHIIEIIEDPEQNLLLSPSTSHDDDMNLIVRVPNDNETVIMLNSDLIFFKMLKSELETLDSIRDEEEELLMRQIDKLSGSVLTLTKKLSDLYTWREFFRIYIDSEVFFRYNETSLTLLERTAEQVKKNLEEFSSRVEQVDIFERLHNKTGVVACELFMGMNMRLLKILQFQAINATALKKILKKFDKQTSLNVSRRFPDLISKDNVFIHGTPVAQNICFLIQSKLLRLIPQIEDYTCPICMSVAFKPIRLTCSHIFCVRCMVKMKQRGKMDCPLCRKSKAIAMANSSNLDVEAMALMKKNFPLEVKEKLRDVDREKYGDVVGNKKCVIM